MKTCHKCKEEKPLSDFYKEKSRDDGRMSICKKCDYMRTSKRGWGNQGRGSTRGKVRERDNYTCQECGLVRTPEQAKEQGKKLFDIHHTNGLCGKKSKGYDSISEMDGLVTLCHKCHFNRHDHTFHLGITH